MTSMLRSVPKCLAKVDLPAPPEPITRTFFMRFLDWAQAMSVQEFAATSALGEHTVRGYRNSFLEGFDTVPWGRARCRLTARIGYPSCAATHCSASVRVRIRPST